MYTIISGTNRAKSHSEKVAKIYHDILLQKGIESAIFTLKDLDVLHKNPEFSKIETELLVPTQKFIFIIPEYNGTFPGVLKAMIDISDVRNVWWWKKALLVGVSTGRAGNLRGMDHLTGSLNFMKVIVHPNKLPLSVIDKIMNEEGNITNENTLTAISLQIDEFINF